LMAEALYPPHHPYSWLTIGVMEDVEAASRDDVEAFFRRFYVPSNASLCLVGDLDEDRGLALAERYFGSLAGGTKALAPWAPEPRLEAETAMVVHDRVELDRDYQAWHSVPQFHADDAPLVLLADILGRGKSSRLYRKLVVEEGLAQDVIASHSSRELAGTFNLVITLRPGQRWERARVLAAQEIQALSTSGATDEELSRVKNSRLAGFVYALDNVGGFGGVADRLNAYNIYLGDPGRITTDLKRYQDVTADDIQRTAGDYLTGRRRVSLTVLGRKAPEVVPPLERSVPPATAPPVVFQAPRPEPFKLRCGVPLWVIPLRDLPIVSATVVIEAGAGVHGPDQGGLAGLTAAMLDEGTSTRSSLDLARVAEGMGTSLTTSCGWDGSYVSLQCLTPHLGASLDLAVDVLRNPAFPEPDWKRVHGQTIAALLAEHDSAEARGYRALLGALYGEGHPYRTPVDGDVATVSALTCERVRGFYVEHYQPTRSAWVVAGDVEPQQFARALDDRLADWSGTASPAPEVSRPSDSPAPRILLLNRPGAAQAAVRVGHVGVHRLHPDYTDLLVLNQVLGGQFTSRLNTCLREAKGLTYGVRSNFDFRRGPGPFTVSTSVQTDRVAEALDELRREVEALVGDRPPTLPELEDARRSLIEGQARHFETPSSLVARYASLFLYGLPADYHARFAERLEAVTVESLVAAATRQIRPRALVAIVVADASLVAAPLERLGWATVEVVDDSQVRGDEKHIG
ncbi:MAG TPA: pitrilysin family protein, partial [Isosphaeraceae bacterium]|nr:pitrilysin family protein [Isosphaeraceae bacterium]